MEIKIDGNNNTVHIHPTPEPKKKSTYGDVIAKAWKGFVAVFKLIMPFISNV